MEQWQKCPVCDGTGNVWSPYSTAGCRCGTCNGHGIINIHTGYPPVGERVTDTWITTNETTFKLQ